MSVYSGARQPQSRERNGNMPGAQQPQAHGNGEIVTIASELLPHSSIVNFQAWLPNIQFSINIIDVSLGCSTNYIDDEKHGLMLKTLKFPEEEVADTPAA